MRSHLTHDFRAVPELGLTHRSTAYLAVIDRESYPTFLRRGADHLDLLSHVCDQVDALTATMWEVPNVPLRLKLVLARDQREFDALTSTGHRVFSGGFVRTGGELILTNQERLLDCARHRRHDLLRGRRADDQDQLLLVPPGVYALTVFSGLPHHGRDDGTSRANAEHYEVVLRHHPHPAPRIAPVRLRSFFANLTAPDLENVAGMKKMPDFSPSFPQPSS
jgi:hypothetical protein